MPSKFLDETGLSYFWGKLKVKFAPIASPAFTGTPTAPTATSGTNNTQIATTAFVKAAIDAIPQSGSMKFTDVSATFEADVSNNGDPTYADAPYRASVALNGVTANMVPQVIYSLEQSMSGKYAQVAETYAGGVYLYGAEAGTITIPSIVLL